MTIQITVTHWKELLVDHGETAAKLLTTHNIASEEEGEKGEGD